MPLELGMGRWLVNSMPAWFHLFGFYAAGSADAFCDWWGKMKNCSLVAQTENTQFSRMLSLRHTILRSARAGEEKRLTVLYPAARLKIRCSPCKKTQKPLFCPPHFCYSSIWTIKRAFTKARLLIWPLVAEMPVAAKYLLQLGWEWVMGVSTSSERAASIWRARCDICSSCLFSFCLQIIFWSCFAARN